MTPLAVTTTGRHPGLYAERARSWATRWGLPFIARPLKAPIDVLLREASALLMFGGEGWQLVDAHGALRFSYGVAALRIGRLADALAQNDQLVRLGELKAGDTVIDGTLGLGADALVSAHVVGPTGHVRGFEASRPLACLVQAGLEHAGSSIDVSWAEASVALAALPARSVDCVFLDPMFDKPKRASPAFEALRRFAVQLELSPLTVHQARRVARRWVVVKGGRFGSELERVGLEPLRLSRFAPTVWARVGPLE